MRLEIWTFVVHSFEVSKLGSWVKDKCILSHMNHEISSWEGKQCWNRFTEKGTFVILLCKTALFRCKSRWGRPLEMASSWFSISFHVVKSTFQYPAHCGIFQYPREFSKNQNQRLLRGIVCLFWEFPWILKNTTVSLELKCWLYHMRRFVKSRNGHLKRSTPPRFVSEKYCFT